MTSENTCSYKWSTVVYSDYKAQLELFYQYIKDKECYPDPEEEKWRWSWLHRSLMTRTVHMLRTYWCI